MKEAFVSFSDAEFKKALRMSRSAFSKLLNLLRDDLGLRSRHGGHAAPDGGTKLEPDARLAIALRMMAGGSLWDLMAIFNVSRPTLYRVFNNVVDVMMARLKLPGLPTDTEPELRRMADEFQRSRRGSADNPLYGCVGAIDGIAVAIQAPPAEYHPAQYYCRKGFYCLPVQAVCDANYRFIYMSAVAVGSTHDSVAFAMSSLWRSLQSARLPAGFWLAGDAAYICSEYLLTPHSKSALGEEAHRVSREAFNFFQSSHRVHIEQAFGMLVARWGILWRPLSVAFSRSALIVAVAMRLHNFCREHDSEEPEPPQTSNASEREAAFSRWWENASALRAPRAGVRRDLEGSALRDALTAEVESLGLIKPPCNAGIYIYIYSASRGAAEPRAATIGAAQTSRKRTERRGGFTNTLDH